MINRKQRIKELKKLVQRAARNGQSNILVQWDYVEAALEQLKIMEKQIEWMTENVIGCPMERTGPHDCLLDSNGYKWCDMCWREAARKATEGK